jgi:hypothetical protein
MKSYGAGKTLRFLGFRLDGDVATFQVEGFGETQKNPDGISRYIWEK